MPRQMPRPLAFLVSLVLVLAVRSAHGDPLPPCPTGDFNPADCSRADVCSGDPAAVACSTTGDTSTECAAGQWCGRCVTEESTCAAGQCVDRGDVGSTCALGLDVSCLPGLFCSWSSGECEAEPRNDCDPTCQIVSVEGCAVNVDGSTVNVSAVGGLQLAGDVLTAVGWSTATLYGGAAVNVASGGAVNVASGGPATLASITGDATIAAPMGAVQLTTPIQLAAPQYTPSPPPAGRVNLYLDAAGVPTWQSPDGSTHPAW